MNGTACTPAGAMLGLLLGRRADALSAVDRTGPTTGHVLMGGPEAASVTETKARFRVLERRLEALATGNSALRRKGAEDRALIARLAGRAGPAGEERRPGVSCRA